MTALAGSGTLLRLALRRDRILLPIWVIALALMPLSVASATAALYPTAAGRQTYYASIAGSSSMLGVVGPVFGSSLGALTAWRSSIMLLFVALISLLTVIRHTRAEEDAGRRELLAAGVTGRLAPLVAALTITVASDLALGTLLAVCLIGYGLPLGGSLAMGAAFAVTGWAFAAVGAVAAQLTEGAGPARGTGLGFLGVVFLLRVVGDSGGADATLAWLSWTSPLGWGPRVRPFADERWWVLAMPLTLALGLAVVAGVLLARRDLGAGMLRPRPGPAAGAPGLRSPLALAWRLHRASLLGWSIGAAVYGIVIGTAAQTVDQLVESSPQLGTLIERLGGVSLLRDAYLATAMGMLSLAVAAYAVQATLRLRIEEASLRAETLLATATSRPRWLASHLTVALVGSASVLAVLGISTGLASGLAVGDVAGQLPRVLAGALVQLPAVWLLAGLATALFGWQPRLAAAGAWTALSGCVFLSFFGTMLELDQRLLDISPFAHVPKLPGGEVVVVPLVVITVIAVLLLDVGVHGFQRRDLAGDA